jgi:hypothetical protein
MPWVDNELNFPLKKRRGISDSDDVTVFNIRSFSYQHPRPSSIKANSFSFTSTGYNMLYY